MVRTPLHGADMSDFRFNFDGGGHAEETAVVAHPVAQLSASSRATIVPLDATPVVAASHCFKLGKTTVRVRDQKEVMQQMTAGSPALQAELCGSDITADYGGGCKVSARFRQCPSDRI